MLSSTKVANYKRSGVMVASPICDRDFLQRCAARQPEATPLHDPARSALVRFAQIWTASLGAARQPTEPSALFGKHSVNWSIHHGKSGGCEKAVTNSAKASISAQNGAAEAVTELEATQKHVAEGLKTSGQAFETSVRKAVADARAAVQKVSEAIAAKRSAASAKKPK